MHLRQEAEAEAETDWPYNYALRSDLLEVVERNVTTNLGSRPCHGTGSIPTNISEVNPPEDAANNCGHPAKRSGPCLGANPLKVGGVAPNDTRCGRHRG